MEYTETSDIEALLAQIDFEKAFDSIEWPFMFKTLEAFNFGPNFRLWIKILYYDIKACVQNNGHRSIFFKFQDLLHRDAQSLHCYSSWPQK